MSSANGRKNRQSGLLCVLVQRRCFACCSLLAGRAGRFALLWLTLLGMACALARIFAWLLGCLIKVWATGTAKPSRAGFSWVILPQTAQRQR